MAFHGGTPLTTAILMETVAYSLIAIAKNPLNTLLNNSTPMTALSRMQSRKTPLPEKPSDDWSEANLELLLDAIILLVHQNFKVPVSGIVP